MDFNQLKEFLDEKVHLYNQSNFIDSDPIQIPHRYTLKEDQEIAGFLAASFAWGNRKMIIDKTTDFLDRMGNSPYDFVMNYSENEFEKIESFNIERLIPSMPISF